MVGDDLLDESFPRIGHPHETQEPLISVKPSEAPGKKFERKWIRGYIVSRLFVGGVSGPFGGMMKNLTEKTYISGLK